MNVVLSLCIEIIKRCTFMLSPIIPGSCEKVFKILNINFNNLSFDNIAKINHESHKINNPTPVFPRIESND